MDINVSTYWDYMMMIAPPAEVLEVIGKYKKATARLIGNYEGMYSQAHISVSRQYRQMPGTMIQKLDWYKRPISRLNPITLQVNGFSFFKQGDTGATIYAKIELNPEVTNWFTHIRKVFGDKKWDAVPHITIAKNVPAAPFQKVWPKISDKQYQFDFLPQSITVLSRPMIGGHNQIWTPFKELYFNNFG
ncbi:2'-5' RNA ligase [Mucilaginibacter gracilis]|uniref:2'-5' RNA ligase n=1 Tax=Mucilaginibacter gracilis TaxID=423350 RepID=A0A495J0G0_9SPHI|nr:2'-5' RNA ligase family protein [Mucilaginibacter gracilis]RKR82465.1 2'-5' RNA ligase [Mucilaginibacter gracilis]